MNSASDAAFMFVKFLSRKRKKCHKQMSGCLASADSVLSIPPAPSPISTSFSLSLPLFFHSLHAMFIIIYIHQPQRYTQESRDR